MLLICGLNDDVVVSLLQLGALGEYPTFSIMIRAKAGHLKLERETKAALAAAAAATPAVARLANGEDPTAIFSELVTMMCNLSPNRSDIAEHVGKKLDVEHFKAAVAEADGWKASIQEQLRFTCFHLDYLASIPHRETIFQYFTATKAALDADMTGKCYVDTYLPFLHESVLRVQREVVEAFDKMQAAIK